MAEAEAVASTDATVAPTDATAGASVSAPSGVSSAASGVASAPSGVAGGWAGATAWALRDRTPLRDYIRTQTGGSAILLAATVVALLWANLDPAGYRTVWQVNLSVRLGDATLGQDLRGWVNSGLMTLFFLVVGLEARREFDLGELRERRQITLPVVAGVCGMLLPVALYLLVNAGTGTARGWGAAMSTDTAFALGVLALLGRRVPEAVRTFILTVSVVDDLCALAVIALAYTEHLRPMPLLVGIAALIVVAVLGVAGVRFGAAFAVLGIVAWTAFLSSGVDPVVVGLGLGLLTFARPALRDDLERATDLFRRFREQPTAELARSARTGLSTAISPNDRLQLMWTPWTSYLIVPLFALANAGVTVDARFLGAAVHSPVTLGIVLGYGLGKPLGIIGGAWTTTLLTRGRLRPPVGWGAVAGGGTIAGIGFTVSLLVATLAFDGALLQEAKLGILVAAAWSSLLTWVVFRVLATLPKRTRLRLLLGTAEGTTDLQVPVDPDRDHFRGPEDAPVTLLEYGDFECPYCGQAEPVVRDLLAEMGDLRYVWRHLPLTDVHPRAQIAAEASEAAAEQGAFWKMHDLLFQHQDALTPRDLTRYAGELGLDVQRFSEDLRRHSLAGRVGRDVETADLSNVSGTPTFFVNGARHYGAYDIASLKAAVKTARARAFIAS